MAEDYSNEQWRPVVGYECWYSVSDHGRVRRDKGGRGARAGHILASHLAKKYPSVVLYFNGFGVGKSVHRLVLESFAGPCPRDCECRHLDSNPTNNHIDNLKWGTHRENTIDTMIHGTVPRICGERNLHAKLTKSQVVEMRAIRKHLGWSTCRIAQSYGIQPRQTRDILSGKSWSHI